MVLVASVNDFSDRRVDFYADGVFLGSTTQRPYAYIWNNVPIGNHIVSAQLVDTNTGQARVRSAATPLTVLNQILRMTSIVTVWTIPEHTLATGPFPPLWYASGEECLNPSPRPILWRAAVRGMEF